MFRAARVEVTSVKTSSSFLNLFPSPVYRIAGVVGYAIR